MKPRPETVFPAIFRYDADYEGYQVFFPDMPFVTCGPSLEEAYLMACDVLRIWLEAPDPRIGSLRPTPYFDVKAEAGDIVLLVHPTLYENGD